MALSDTSRREISRRDVSFRSSLSRRDVRFHVATSKFHLSATSRRGFLHRDVILTPFCHVATCIFTSRRQKVTPFVTLRRVFSRRDVTPHVAMWAYLLSVTSRREPACRDVDLFLAQEWFIFHLQRTPLFL